MGWSCQIGSINCTIGWLINQCTSCMNEFLFEFIRQGTASLLHPPPGSILIRAASGHLLEFVLADSFSSSFGRGHDRTAPGSAKGVYQVAQRFHVVGRYSQLNHIILVYE